MKWCYACKQDLDFSCFGKNKSKKDGLSTECKSCKKISDVKSYKRNLPRFKKYALTKGKLNYQKYYSTPKGFLEVVYHNILNRCNKPNVRSYNRYGGRGIQCKFTSLNDFRGYVLNVLKINPLGLTIDRINNDGHYERGNIRFVTMEDNRKNKGQKR
jgi:hypothetical protein